MKINNTVPYFLENYIPSVEFLERYHRKFAPQFKEYFLYHCHNSEYKIKNAIQQYPKQMDNMRKSSEKIESLILAIASVYEQRYEVEFTKEVHIIVGAYGSNAFTQRQIIPEVTFCLEKISSCDEHLQVIIAHEFGHVVHHLLSDRNGIDWNTIDWFHPFTTLFQEGCATYLSERVCVAEKSVYFSYDEHGKNWLQFAKCNKSHIMKKFLNDVENYSPMEIFKEWFSINGGLTFGHSRLGYFIGYHVVLELIKKYQEERALTIWKNSNFQKEIKNTLLEFIKE